MKHYGYMGANPLNSSYVKQALTFVFWRKGLTLTYLLGQVVIKVLLVNIF